MLLASILLTISRAWVFAAGLYLGFAIFAEGKTVCENDAIFGKAREVLREFANWSPQAAHYYEILCDFSDEIDKSRREILRKRRKSSTAYVDEIFTLRHEESRPEVQYSTPHSGEMLSNDMGTSTWQEHNAVDLDQSHISEMQGTSFDVQDWTQFAMQLPDGLLDDLEPLGISFDLSDCVGNSMT